MSTPETTPHASALRKAVWDYLNQLCRVDSGGGASYQIPALDEADESLVSKRRWARTAKCLELWLAQGNALVAEEHELHFEESGERGGWFSFIDVLGRISMARLPRTSWLTTVMELQGTISLGEYSQILWDAFAREYPGLSRTFETGADILVTYYKASVSLSPNQAQFVLKVPSNSEVKTFGEHAAHIQANLQVMRQELLAFLSPNLAQGADSTIRLEQAPAHSPESTSVAAVTGAAFKSATESMAERLKYWWATEGLGITDKVTFCERGLLNVSLRSYVSPRFPLSRLLRKDGLSASVRFEAWVQALRQKGFDIRGGEPAELPDNAQNREALHQLIQSVFPSATIWELRTVQSRMARDAQGNRAHIIEAVEIFVSDIDQVLALPAPPADASN